MLHYFDGKPDADGRWSDVRRDEVRLREGRVVLTRMARSTKLGSDWTVSMLLPWSESLPELPVQTVVDALTGLDAFESLNPTQRSTIIAIGGGQLGWVRDDTEQVLRELVSELDAVLRDEAQFLISER